MHFWAITLWTWIIYVPLMSIHLIVILFVKQNILILFKRNPCVTKTSHMWKSLLIFFFCILIIDIFHFWRCSTKGAALRKEPHIFLLYLDNRYFSSRGALRKELLYERSRTSPQKQFYRTPCKTTDTRVAEQELAVKYFEME